MDKSRDRALYEAARADAGRLRALWEERVEDVLDTLVELNMMGISEARSLATQFEVKTYEMHDWSPTSQEAEYLCMSCGDTGDGMVMGPCYAKRVRTQ